MPRLRHSHWALLLVLGFTGKVGFCQIHGLTEEEWKASVDDGYVFFEIMEPKELQYTYKVNPSAFGGYWNETWVGVGLVPTDPPCGCGYIMNHEDVEGRIALIDRGQCSFQSKVIRAQEAGALAVIITEPDAENDDLYITMQDDTTDRAVDIPSAFLLGKNGYIIRNTLYRLGLNEATINIPVNITTIPMHKLKQPPWIVW